MKGLLIGWLTTLAKRIVAKYHPDIIGITGSVGKTTTKEAIAAVLDFDYRIGKSEKNYNNELGVPLSIIGAPAPRTSLIAWLGVFVRAAMLLLRTDPHYPRILILEMAADRPGDIRTLTAHFSCRVGVVTAVGPAHMEFFGTVEAIAEEKAHMVRHLPATGFAVLNGDDPLVTAMAESLEAPVALYGFTKKAEVRATEPKLVVSREPSATDAISGGTLPYLETHISYEGKTVTLATPHIIGKPIIRALLAAITIGIAYDVGFDEAVRRLADFQPPPGRMRLLRGINHSLLIDDTYNASPPAVLEALRTLKRLESTGRRIAVLGDMAELGSAVDEGNAAVGKLVEANCHLLITVGDLSKGIAKAANKAGMHAASMFSFPTAVEAGDFLARTIDYGDVVLIKGSQVARMEKVVKRIMAEPMRASELLVRQGREWSKE